MRRRRRGARVALDLAARAGPVRDVPGVGGDERERRRAVLARALLDQGAPLPPEGVHAMTRGAEHVVGGLRHADLVAAALQAAGGDIAGVDIGLDFGCSSGRVVRALAGANPDVTWRACDPNPGAIAWASEHLRGIDFFVAPLDPPLPLDDRALDLVVAISIWSHYGPTAATLWLEEMHRIVKPGGHLVLTVHGAHSLALFAREGLRDDDLLARAAAGLNAEGHFFHDEFGDAGDEGLVHPEWGLAFLTLEWLAVKATPNWSIAYFAPGAADGNQDVVVLRRR
jgi:SAM-dependent methyltransferase